MPLTPTHDPAVVERRVTVPTDAGRVSLRLVRPQDRRDVLPGILYMHGGEWLPDNRAVYEHLVRRLAVGADAAVLFVEYHARAVSRRMAIEQGYAAARWIVHDGPALRIDADRLAVVGDALGATMATDLALLAGERADVRFVHQSMYHPIDSRAGTPPSPLCAGDERLAALPPAFIIAGMPGSGRDDGAVYAARLTAAGVPVTTAWFTGTTHELLDPEAQSDATRTRVDQAIAILHDALHPEAHRDHHMHQIRVSIVSPQEARDGTAELWAAGRMIGFTRIEDGDLMVRLEPGVDGDGVVLGAHSLADALAEADRLLATY